MEDSNFTDHFLIAMPNMVDPNFAGTLTYICDHGKDGALGMVVNRPIELTIDKLFEQLGLATRRRGAQPQPVYFGGPVQVERGFVLHRPVGEWNSTLTVNDHIGLTTSKDILEAAALHNGPSRYSSAWAIPAGGRASWRPRSSRMPG
jgi:putative transcriptional regulator